MSSKSSIRSCKSRSNTGSVDSSHYTSGDDVTTYQKSRGRFTKQRSVTDVLSNFVGNGARRFRNLVTRMNRQRRHVSSPNIAVESSDVSDAEMLSERCGSQSKHQLTDQEDLVHIDRNCTNENHIDKTRIAQRDVDKKYMAQSLVNKPCKADTEQDKKCTTQSHIFKACTSHTFKTSTIHTRTTQTEVHKACTVRSENEAVLRLLVNREKQMKRTLLPGPTTLPRCEPGATQGERVHFAVNDRGNLVDPRRHGRRASLTVMPSVEDHHSHDIFFFRQTGDRRPNSIDNMCTERRYSRTNCTGHAPRLASSDSIGPVPTDMNGKSVSSFPNIFNTNNKAAGSCISLTRTSDVCAASSSRGPSTNQNSDHQVQTVTDECTRNSRDGLRANQVSDDQLKISTNKSVVTRSGGSNPNKDSDDQLKISTNKSVVTRAGGSNPNKDSDDQLKISTNKSVVTRAGGSNPNKDSDDQLKISTNKSVVTRAGGSNPNKDSDDQLKISTNKTVVTRAGGSSPNKDSDDQQQISTYKYADARAGSPSSNEYSDKRLQISTDLYALPSAGGLHADKDRYTRLQTQPASNTNCNDLDTAAASASSEWNDREGVSEYRSASSTVRRKTVGHAFGKYVGKQAGRFRSLVLRLNSRTHRHGDTNNSLVSSNKEITSLQSKVTPNECNNGRHFPHDKRKRKVSRSYHNSDFMLYSDGGDASNEGSCDDADGRGGGGDGGYASYEDGCDDGGDASTENESQSLVVDSNNLTLSFLPTNTINSNNEKEKNKPQERENDNGSVPCEPCIECVKDNKGTQKRRPGGFENKKVLTSADVVDGVHSKSEFSLVQQSSSPQRPSQSPIGGIKSDQRVSVQESDIQTAKPTVITNKKNIISRSLSLNPDKYSQFVDVIGESESYLQTDVAGVGHVTENDVENHPKKYQHSKKQFYKQLSFDRLATFMTKRSGHFRKLFTKANRHDSVCTDVNKDVDSETAMLATEVSVEDVCKDAASDKCTPDTRVCHNDPQIHAKQTLSNPINEASCTRQERKENIELQLFGNKRIQNDNYTDALQNGYFSPETSGLTVEKKENKEPNGRLTVSCSQILLEINSDNQTENNTYEIALKDNTTKSNVLQSTESTPAHLDVTNELDGKKLIGKTISCSPTFLRSNFVEHPDFSQILTFLSLGSIETASNGHLLCKFGIDSLIDISSVSFEALRQQRVCYPCLCSKRNHFRPRLNINIEDIEWENIEEHFKNINTFIEGARLSGKSVLVYSYHGNSRAAALIVQYLMRHFRMSLTAAYSLVSARRPSVCVNPGFQKALRRLESKLLIKWKKHISSCEMEIGKYLLKPATRQAWTVRLESDD